MKVVLRGHLIAMASKMKEDRQKVIDELTVEIKDLEDKLKNTGNKKFYKLQLS